MNCRPTALFLACLTATLLPPPLQASADEIEVPPGTVIYSAPSYSSRKLGEFKRQAFVEPVRIERGWAQIDHPDHGYIPIRVDAPAKKQKSDFAVKATNSKDSTAALKEALKEKDRRISELEQRLAEKEGLVDPEPQPAPQPKTAADINPPAPVHAEGWPTAGAVTPAPEGVNP